MQRKTLAVLAALSGFVSVTVGAFAAHGVQDERAAELLRLGASYQAVHALAALLSLLLARSAAPALFLIGTVLFSGSLYALAFGAPSAMGMITPIGGLSLLGGWLALAWSVRRLEGWPGGGGNG